MEKSLSTLIFCHHYDIGNFLFSIYLKISLFITNLYGHIAETFPVKNFNFFHGNKKHSLFVWVVCMIYLASKVLLITKDFTYYQTCINFFLCWQVTYIPHEVGIFDVRVQWNKRDVAGSPFHPKIIDPARVRLIGGWLSLLDSQDRLELTPREEKRLAFDVSEAGPGRLRAELSHEGQPIEVGVDQNGPRARLLFTPPGEGSYELCLWYSDLLLPNMPIYGIAEPVNTGDHTRVTLRGHGLTTARCGDRSEFVIDGSLAGPGAPDVTMTGTKADVNVALNHQGGGIWQAEYTPMVPGAYLLNVMWSDRQVRGCPLKVNVESVADASRVVCSGEGLRHGMVGNQIKSFIDTRRAGPGELTVTCMGPQKVALCDLEDHGDGTFTLNVRPQVS